MNGILIPTQIENVSTRKDRTVKIVLGTQELTPEQAGKLYSLQNQVAFTYIKTEGITDDEVDIIDTSKADLPGKTPSARMRSVLFVLWKQDAEGFDKFRDFYEHKMQGFIDHLKTKIKD